MKAGDIVLVDWRDALPGSGEPTKRRPGIIVGSDDFFAELAFRMVVPMTGEKRLSIYGASTAILPSRQNGCTKTTFALSWNVQTVPLARIRSTSSRVTEQQVSSIRLQIIDCIGALTA